MPTLSRRGLARAFGGGLALVATSAAGKRRRRKKPKFRTVTKTFTNAAPIAIEREDLTGRSDPFPSRIQVSGFKQGKLLDVNVALRNLGHVLPENIDIQLVAPNGRRAQIMSDVGSTVPVTGITLTLDDQAAAKLPRSSQLGTGRFKPADYEIPLNNGDPMPAPAPAGDPANVKLATFAGINPNGIWSLYVFDDFRDFEPSGGNVSAGWSLTIKAKVRR